MFSTENVNVFNQCRGFMKNIKKKGLKISEAVQMDEGKIIQKKKDKKTNNHLQYITQKTKD